MESTQNSDSIFTTYHMKCINRFRWVALSRSVIKRDDYGGYFIKPSPFLCQLVFYIYFVNTLAKLIFLAFVVTDQLGPIEFLDRIGGFDWMLCGLMVCIAYTIWQRYPLYEVIYRLWEIENRIYRRLGCPREIKWEAEEKHSVTVWAHLILTCVGCCSLTKQFLEAPKYCVFTYSLLEVDSPFLRGLFALHECIFLSHAWAAMSASNGLCTFEAVNLQLIIKEMTKAVDSLAEHQRFSHAGEFSLENGSIIVTNSEGPKLGGRNSRRDNDVEEEDYTGRSQAFRYNNGPGEIKSVSVADDHDHIQNESVKMSRHHLKLLRNSSSKLSSASSLSSSTSRSYSFRRILHDYQQLMLASEMFNAWVGYKIVGLSICGFCQYISSTTMAFQVLRMEGTGIGDIIFYIQDCAVAVYVTFRVFDYMSIVLPASQEFMNSVRRYMAAGVVNGRLRKFQRTLRPVTLKLGPTPWRREAVLDTMEMLASYYVCVALW